MSDPLGGWSLGIAAVSLAPYREFRAGTDKRYRESIAIRRGPMTQPSPFKETTAAEQGFLARVLRRPRPDAAEAEIRTLLATLPPKDVYRTQLDLVFEKHRVSDAARRRMLDELWKEALTVLAGDDIISDTEADYLTDLMATLDVPNATARRFEADVLHPKYETLVRRSIADGHLTPGERQQLDALAKALHLSPEEAREIYGKSAAELLQSTLNSALEDERLSPTEFKEFALLAQRLGIEPSFDDATQARMHRFALLWRIENGELPTIAVPINLQRGEVCHLSGEATWHELRTRTERVVYSGTSVSIPIMKGVRYRVSSYRPQRVTRQELTPIDSGPFYVTSKRVIFDGVHKNSAIRYSSLIGVTPYSDGIKLEKSSGRSPYLLFDGDVEMVTVILTAAMASA